MTYEESDPFAAPEPQPDGPDRNWVKIGTIFAVVMALVISLVANGLLFVSLNGVKGDLSVLQDEQGILADYVATTSQYDGELDYSTALADAGTYELIRSSIRDAVFRYADAEGVYAGSAVVTAIVVSDDYVLVPAAAIPAEDSGYSIIVAGMRSSALDVEAGVEEFDMSQAPLIDLTLGFAVMRRPADTVLDVVPLLDMLGDVRDIRLDSALVSPGTVALNDQAPNEAGGQIADPSKVDLISGGRILARNIRPFQPVYALRDGLPELIGVSIAGNGNVVPVVTIYELVPLFAQMGIQITFPE